MGKFKITVAAMGLDSTFHKPIAVIETEPELILSEMFDSMTASGPLLDVIQGLKAVISEKAKKYSFTYDKGDKIVECNKSLCSVRYRYGEPEEKDTIGTKAIYKLVTDWKKVLIPWKKNFIENYKPSYSAGEVKDFFPETKELKNAPLPPKGKLKQTALKLNEDEQAKALLYRIVGYCYEALRENADNIERIRAYQKQGGNINNVLRMGALADTLESLNLFCNCKEALAAYFAEEIIQNDLTLLVLARAVANNFYQLSEPEGEMNVVKSICQKLYHPEIKSEGQKNLKALLLKWSILKKSSLPAEERMKVPQKLPSNISELKTFYGILPIKRYFRLKNGNSGDPIKWPADIRAVYKAFDGSGLPDFMPLKNQKRLKKSIDWCMKNFEDEDDFEQDEKNEVDLRKYVHDGIILIGEDASGDVFFADPATKSITGSAIIIRACHDQAWTGVLTANSLAEFVARLCIDKYQSSISPDSDLEKLKKTRVGIARKSK